MRRYIDADKIPRHGKRGGECYWQEIEQLQTADVVEVDKAQKEIDYWHDKAQSYEQTILKLSLNKADVVEVVRCRDCKHRDIDRCGRFKCDVWVCDEDYCSYGERAE